MATGPTGDADERLAGLGHGLRELQGKIETLRRSVAELHPSSIPTPAPPEPPDPLPAPEPAPAGPAPEGDELVARLRSLLDELREITEAAMPRSEPTGKRPERPGASAAAGRSRR